MFLSFQGFSGKAKWGKRQAKKRAKIGNVPVAPVMFQKSSFVLGEKGLDVVKKEETFDLMTIFEREGKLRKLELQVKKENEGLEMKQEKDFQ